MYIIATRGLLLRALAKLPGTMPAVPVIFCQNEAVAWVADPTLLQILLDAMRAGLESGGWFVESAEFDFDMVQWREADMRAAKALKGA